MVLVDFYSIHTSNNVCVKMLGKASDPVPPSDDGKIAFNAVKDEFLNAAAVSGDVKLISEMKQVVAGINYFLKLQVADSYFVARIYRNLQGQHELTSWKPTTEQAELAYFE